MGFFTRVQKHIQNKRLQGDVEKGVSAKVLADKYPMSLLVQKDVFKRFNGTELYVPTTLPDDLYDIQGSFLGTRYDFANTENEYIIVVKEDGKFENSTVKSTFAIYDKAGKCVIPHNCYSTCFLTNNYAILSTCMEASNELEREARIQNDGDDNKITEATGLTLKETLGGSLINPKVLIVSKNGITATKYLSVEPLKVYGDRDVYPHNTVWIAQTDKDEEITFKLDKNLKLLETYRFALYAHLYEAFFMDSKTNAVYWLDIENKRRINLRTGDYINLLNLKRAHLSKQERFAVEEEQLIDDIVDGVIPEEEIAEVEEIVEVEEVVEEEKEEEQDFSVIGEDEIGEYDPSLDVVVDDDNNVIGFDNVLMAVDEDSEIADQDEEVVDEVTIV